MYILKMFKFLNQCFAQLRLWKSVSDSRNLLDGATAFLLETLFQNRSRAKHWFKNLNILVTNLSLNSNLKNKSYPYFSTSRTVFSNEFKIKSDIEYMEKYCRFLLGARSLRKRWLNACKKFHNAPKSNPNQKSTLVMAEKKKSTGDDLVKTTDPEMYIRII